MEESRNCRSELVGDWWEEYMGKIRPVMGIRIDANDL